MSAKKTNLAVNVQNFIFTGNQSKTANETNFPINEQKPILQSAGNKA
jgi:hypothetical protein